VPAKVLWNDLDLVEVQAKAVDEKIDDNEVRVLKVPKISF